MLDFYYSTSAAYFQYFKKKEDEFSFTVRIFSLLPHAPINCDSAAFGAMVTCCIETIAVIFQDFVFFLTIKSRNCKMHTYFNY